MGDAELRIDRRAGVIVLGPVYEARLTGAVHLDGGDLDVLIRPTVENAERLLDALRAFGFPISDLTPAAVADRRKLLEMGVPPVQIHVMSSISGVEWEEAWADRVEAVLRSHTVPLLGRRTFLQTAGHPNLGLWGAFSDALSQQGRISVLSFGWQ